MGLGAEEFRGLGEQGGLGDFFAAAGGVRRGGHEAVFPFRGDRPEAEEKDGPHQPEFAQGRQHPRQGQAEDGGQPRTPAGLPSGQGGHDGEEDEKDQRERVAGFVVAPREEQGCRHEQPSGPSEHGARIGALDLAEQGGPAWEEFAHGGVGPRVTKSFQSPRGEGQPGGEQEGAAPDGRPGGAAQGEGSGEFLGGEKDERLEPRDPEGEAPRRGGSPGPSGAGGADEGELGGERDGGEGDEEGLMVGSAESEGVREGRGNREE